MYACTYARISSSFDATVRVRHQHGAGNAEPCPSRKLSVHMNDCLGRGWLLQGSLMGTTWRGADMHWKERDGPSPSG